MYDLLPEEQEKIYHFLKGWGLYFSNWYDMLFCVGIIEELIDWDWEENAEEEWEKSFSDRFSRN